jgi:hypothetical protein
MEQSAIIRAQPRGTENITKVLLTIYCRRYIADDISLTIYCRRYIFDIVLGWAWTHLVSGWAWTHLVSGWSKYMVKIYRQNISSTIYRQHISSTKLCWYFLFHVVGLSLRQAVQWSLAQILTKYFDNLTDFWDLFWQNFVDDIFRWTIFCWWYIVDDILSTIYCWRLIVDEIFLT